MSNATKRGNVGTTPFGDYVTKRGCVSTAQVFYPNCMVGLNSSGYLDKMDDAAAKQFDGVIGSVQFEVLSGGSDGDVLADVVQPRFITCAIAAAVASDVGRLAYASDDQTVSLTPGSFGNVVGRIAAVISSTVVVVEAIYFKGKAGGGNLQVAPADGAVPIKGGTVVITKAGVAALTLADPTSGTHDGVEMTFISATASAHTLSNAAGSGFNAGGAGADVGTFGGAKGDGLTVVAYQGKWYVKSKTNVTLA
jgi:hypothetical protein